MSGGGRKDDGSPQSDGLLLVLVPGGPLINARGRAAVRALPTASMLNVTELAAGFQASPPSPELPCEGVQRSKSKSSFAKSSPGLQGACGASAALLCDLPERSSQIRCPLPRSAAPGQRRESSCSGGNRPWWLRRCPHLPLAWAEPVLPANRRGWFKGHVSKPNNQDANLPLRVVAFKVHWTANSTRLMF